MESSKKKRQWRGYVFSVLAAGLLALVAGTAFSSGAVAAEAAKLKVTATIFPLYDFARQVGGDRVEVSLLLPPGVEAHTYAPRPGDMIRLGNAEIFLYTGELMEPWAENLVKGVDSPALLVVDTSRGIELAEEDEHDEHVHFGEAESSGHAAASPEEHHGHDQKASADAHAGGASDHHHLHHGKDPHIWLDPVLARIMVRTIAEAFAAKDPAGAESYRNNAESYAKELAALDREITEGLSACERRTIIYGGHFAFGYFARRYGLEHVSPYPSFAPDAEPSPRAVAELVETMKRTGASVIYHEELIDPKVARAIASETGARLLLLHGAHNLSREEREQGLTYLQIMRDNLARLREGLACR
ncbi:metal ABC transporter solute-binding protein, Zn/Mn family [Aminiphilus circumscriptus]|uniref:metal ABC transporter solute-binding protein, Zn/Mn family n=1 Tax=Aminiphilus circumscriptus TaxID=290732 RepID=UPI0004785E0D|nr:zinc ABC transporter substrate-binding protein [Aminiphilus circumscriptus]